MKIYVGNIANSATEQELNDVFTPFGEVISAKIIKDKFTGESRGFGFVEMQDKDAAQEAINNLNGTDFAGQQIRVNEARPPREGSRGGFGGRGGPGGGGGNRGGNDGGGYNKKRW